MTGNTPFDEMALTARIYNMCSQHSTATALEAMEQAYLMLLVEVERTHAGTVAAFERALSSFHDELAQLVTRG